MRTWAIVVAGVLLSAALVVTIAHRGFKRDKTMANHAANFHQQIQQTLPVAHPITSPESADTGKTLDIEPWGPVRAVDW